VVALVRLVWTLPTNVFGHAAGLVVSGRRPDRVGGPAAIGWLYSIRPGIGLDWVGAVTLGHAILHRPAMFQGPTGRAILAHELAHTRQHDVLGPLYLPLHILAQLSSAALSLVVPGAVPSRVHAYNPLEHTFICLGARACRDLARGEILPPAEVERYLAQFGA
jgi:hypothetical protein